MRTFNTPTPVNVDAYQAGHFEMIPTGMDDFQLSHGIFRKQLHWGDQKFANGRLISAGLAPFLALEPGIARPMTQQDIEESEDFYSDFNLGTMEYPWPKEMFERVVNEYGGFFPICIMGMFDGQSHYVGEPHVQIWTDEPGMGECVGWLESSLLPYLWTSASVATRGRNRLENMIQVYAKAYPSKNLKELKELVATKFHDFGRRGGASSQITGIAHLINWLGTDVCDAAFAAKKYLNDGQSFGANSIPAAAHRTITPHATEDAAYERHIELFKKYPVIAIVADSYGFTQGINKLASYAEVIKLENGFLVGRPDSGDPTECVLEGLEVFGEAFGTETQESGLKVINNAAIIQGDGVSDRIIFESILPAVMAKGFCPSNVGFGMGEYNHRCVRSDTEEAYKTALVGTEADGKYRECMKGSENFFKRSVPGPVAVHCDRLDARVVPITLEQLKQGEAGDLNVMYDRRPNPLPVKRELFEQTRTRSWESWLQIPQYYGDTFATELREKQTEYLDRMSEQMG